MADGKGMFKGASEGGLFVTEKKSGKNNRVGIFLVFLIGLFAVLFIYNNQQQKARQVKMEELMSNEVSPDVQYEFYENGEQANAVVTDVTTMKTVPDTSVVSTTIPAVSVNDSSVVTSPMASIISGAYSIQVASFKEQSRADKVVAELTAKNFQPYVVSKDLGEKGVWYRVYVGSFSTKQEATSFKSTLPALYKDGIVMSSKK